MCRHAYIIYPCCERPVLGPSPQNMSMEEPLYLTKNHLEYCERGSVHNACDRPRVSIILTYPVSCPACKERWVLRQSQKVFSGVRPPDNNETFMETFSFLQRLPNPQEDYPRAFARATENTHMFAQRWLNKLLMNLDAAEQVVRATWQAELLSLVPAKAGYAPYPLPTTQTFNYRAFTATLDMLARRVPEVRKAETFLAVTDMQDEGTVDDALKWEYSQYKDFLRLTLL
ncbi:hypothetical protein B0T24DRAFT_665365 [Lasiosphaeria ovina]|uniref:Uncharacterized protein n=1 Tax=Lasiosphaeria ovina TaxID=92902 RepID=A0AAE0KID2_9PEZI|nr:hypothetical protein B0T24DRAFT_665365 [Lasiosphaeria ovina]